MDLKDVTKDLANQNNYRIVRRFEEMIRTNPRYKNLDAGNRQLILELIKKYQEKIRHGLRPSPLTIREDKYRLYENRFKLGLSPEDLAQINSLLDSFKE